MKGTLSISTIIKGLKQKEVSLFTPSDFKKFFKIKKKNTAYKILERLTKKGILNRLIKRKYFFVFSESDDFQIANFLYSPSYISLESALSFYGIITQFPYQITSIAPKKTRTIKTIDKKFSYSHIKPQLFFNYEKKEKFLIASPEKALFDYLYFCSKGLKNFEKDDFDLKIIDKKKFLILLKETKQENLRKFLNPVRNSLINGVNRK
jgi:predicted transcriptional regulator of viral defense system